MSSWLSDLGLSSENASAYNSIFHQEAITEKALRLLTLQDLETLGVTSFVHRILIHNSLKDSRLCIIMLQNFTICVLIENRLYCVDLWMIISRLKYL